MCTLGDRLLAVEFCEFGRKSPGPQGNAYLVLIYLVVFAVRGILILVYAIGEIRKHVRQIIDTFIYEVPLDFREFAHGLCFWTFILYILHGDYQIYILIYYLSADQLTKSLNLATILCKY